VVVYQINICIQGNTNFPWGAPARGRGGAADTDSPNRAITWGAVYIQYDDVPICPSGGIAKESQCNKMNP